MTTPAEYALLAAGSYSDIRQGEYRLGKDTDNGAPLPAGWTEMTEFRRSGSGDIIANLTNYGFSARVYRNTATQEIVISYAGTRGDPGLGLFVDFLNGNVPLAVGLAGEQGFKAAKLFQQVTQLYGRDNVSLTGHSLGGGLAALMGVYFDRPAYVFAPAPFEAAADGNQLVYVPGLINSSLGATKAYLQGELGWVDPVLASYEPSEFMLREQRVQSWAVKGEVLEQANAWTRNALNWIEREPRSPLFTSPDITLGHTNKHSIDLHAAGLLVPSFQVSAALVPNSLTLMFSPDLYDGGINGSSQVFTMDLLRNQVGIRAEDGTLQRAPNGMLTHFSGDLGKLGANVAGLNQAAQDALVAQLIEWYRFQPDNYSGQQFFAVSSGNTLQYTTAQGAALPGVQNRAGAFCQESA